MLGRELQARIADQMTLGRQLRQFIASLKFGEVRFDAAAAEVLQSEMIRFDTNGQQVIDGLLEEVRQLREPDLFGRSHGEEPRMIHDMPAVYQPDAQRRRLQDMAHVAAASNVVPLRPAPKGGAK